MFIDGVYGGARGEKVVDVASIDLHETLADDEQKGKNQAHARHEAAALKCGKGQAEAMNMLGQTTPCTGSRLSDSCQISQTIPKRTSAVW